MGPEKWYNTARFVYNQTSTLSKFYDIYFLNTACSTYDVLLLNVFQPHGKERNLSPCRGPQGKDLTSR
jgi:hypothetical protein